MRNAGVVFGLLLAVAAGQGDAKTRPRTIDQILAEVRGATWGIHIVDLQTGATVYSKNPGAYFIPASNTKLFSTAFALSRLGPDYRFRTTITAPEKPDANGRVTQLRLVGGGDPNLSGRTLPYKYKAEPGNPLQAIEQFAQQLVDGGLKFVDGDIVGDNSAYTNEPFPEGWAVDDPLYDYGAPVSALFINDGVLTLRVSPTTAGESPIAEFEPAVEGLVLHNYAVTGSLTKLEFSRLPGSNELRMTGSVADEREYTFAVDDPALFAAGALRDALLKRGVRISGVARAEHSPAPGVPLVTHDSARLADVLTPINKESLNLHAEIMLLETGRARSGEGTRDAALKEMKAFLKTIGIEDREYTFEDGSGLSRKTLVTPEAVTKLLRFMYASPQREAWIATLPIAGEDGTLDKRFLKNRQARAIRAKTGSLSHVNALSGYLGDRYAFSILVNNSNVSAAAVRRAMDEIALRFLR